MAKKKHRPASPSANVRAANRQRSVAQQKGEGTQDPPLHTSSSSIAKPQEELTMPKTSDSPKPALAVTEERQSEDVTSKQVKSPSDGGGGSAHSSATSAAERRRKRVESRKGAASVHSTARSVSSAGEKRRRSLRKSWWQRNSFALIGGILLVVLIVVGVFVVIANSPSQQVGNGKISGTDPKILKEVTTVNQGVFANVGNGGIQNALKPAAGNPPLLTGTGGKPKIFFYGAEFCPLCAGERWSVTIALSRFGTFKQLPLTVSADPGLEPQVPDIATFTFRGSEYNSDYINFDSVEALDRSKQPLDTPSTAQQQLVDKYDVDGSGQKGGFPFIDIANKYVASGAMFDPTPLKGLSQQQIAGMLSDPTQDVTRNIVGAANYFTAAICIATNNQPANVCNNDPIPTLRNALSANAVVSASPLSVVEGNCPGAEAASCRRRENSSKKYSDL